jgi:catalase
VPIPLEDPIVSPQNVSNETLIKDLLDSLDELFGLHPGYRAVHAKGIICWGAFTPAPQATQLTRAPHVARPTTRVIARLSDFAGVPNVPDNDPSAASPRGMAIRFYLAPHVHTDIVAHSHDGFPVRTGEEFLQFARALVASAKATKPIPLDALMASNPKVRQFLEAPKPIPASFARESYFSVAAMRFVNAQGLSRYGRFRIRPAEGNEYLSESDAASKSRDFLIDELTERLSRGPVSFRIAVQLAGPGDEVADSTATWPASRPEVEFGTVTLTHRADESDPEIRKIIFDPIPRVDGIEASLDPLLEVRAAIYLLSGRRRRAAAMP